MSHATPTGAGTRRPTPRPRPTGRPPSHRLSRPVVHLNRLVLAVAAGLTLVLALACAVAAPAPDDVAPAATATRAPDRVRATDLRIPSIGVSTRLVELSTDRSGVLVPPASADVAGWYGGSPLPGELGAGVIAGHVDSRAGPGVFFRLRDLTPGAVVTVGRSDGTAVDFRVVDVSRFRKDAFPTAMVYGPSPVPALRLLTCGGPFDRSARSYLDNVIVDAVENRT